MRPPSPSKDPRVAREERVEFPIRSCDAASPLPLRPHRSTCMAVGAVLFFALFLEACESPHMDSHPGQLPSFRELGVGAAESLTHRSIFFGHQSVGDNLLQGMVSVGREHPAWNLRITKAADTPHPRGPVLVHARVGKNGDPDSKMQAFARYLESAQAPYDIAFFKFCYVDVTAATDPDRLFSTYEKTMTDLRARFSITRFIHVTVPLSAIETGPKAWFNRVRGHPSTVDHNRQRDRYNQLLRSRYAGREPIFDLARVESTTPDGYAHTWTTRGVTVPALVAEYTSDGAHLNALGQRISAEQLLITLAHAAKRPPAP